MAKFYLAKSKEIQERTGLFNVFIPCWESDELVCNKLGRGEIIECKTISERDVVRHRKYFALLNKAIENMPEHLEKKYPSLDALRQAVTIEVGYYDVFYDFQGNEFKRAKSIAFDKMDNIEFKNLYDRTLDALLKYIFIGMTEQDFQDNILSFVK